ncbi:MAG: hypothetical protein HYX32_10735 [Actinobacteria bacterium]|nr:hypothetical protein [Actinomycetota bacterium]
MPRKPDDAPPSWLDLWLDATTWWVEPAARAVEPAARASAQLLTGQPPERALAELADGIARRFSGEHLELVLHDRKAGGRLDSLRIFRTRDRYEARADLSDGTFDGVPIDQVSIAVRSVAVEPGTPARLTGEGITITGTAGLERLVAWLDQRIDTWKLSVDSTATIVAVPHGRRLHGLSFVVDPSVRDDVLHLELRGGRWRRLRFGLPGWLRFTRTIDLPALSNDLALAEARVSDGQVEFRLRQPSASGTIDLTSVREAIVRGTQIIVG